MLHYSLPHSLSFLLAMTHLSFSAGIVPGVMLAMGGHALVGGGASRHVSGLLSFRKPEGIKLEEAGGGEGAISLMETLVIQP